VHTGAIVAANSVLLNGTIVPSGALAVGAPATIKEGKAKSGYIEYAAQSYVAKSRRFKSDLRRID
jgi:carbonic anhydrase/acetyltransferase-like protein (isoleucine patch superfamily)